MQRGVLSGNVALSGASKKGVPGYVRLQSAQCANAPSQSGRKTRYTQLWYRHTRIRRARGYLGGNCAGNFHQGTAVYAINRTYELSRASTAIPQNINLAEVFYDQYPKPTSKTHGHSRAKPVSSP